MVLDGCGLVEGRREGCLGWSVYGKDWHAEGVLDILLEWLSLASDLAVHSFLSSFILHEATCPPAWGAQGQQGDWWNGL